MNLSIFNFDNWRRLAIHVIRNAKMHALMLAGLGGAFAIAWWALQPMCDAKSGGAGVSGDEKNLQGAEVIILGNSQMQRVLPEHLSLPSINRALPGSDYMMQYAILTHLAQRMPNLHYVVLGFGGLPLHVPAIKNHNGDYRDINAAGVPWWGIPGVSLVDRITYRVEYDPLTYRFFKGPKLDGDQMLVMLHDALKKKSVGLPTAKASPPPVRTPLPVKIASGATTTTKTGPPPAPPAPTRTPLPAGYNYYPDQGANKMRDYVSSFKNGSNADENWKYYRRICLFCRDKGYALIIIRVPTSRSFWQARPPLWYAQMQQMEQYAASKLPTDQLFFWNFEQKMNLPDEFFIDPNHLMPNGAVLLTKSLDEQMKSLPRKK